MTHTIKYPSQTYTRSNPAPNPKKKEEEDKNSGPTAQCFVCYIEFQMSSSNPSRESFQARAKDADGVIRPVTSSGEMVQGIGMEYVELEDGNLTLCPACLEGISILDEVGENLEAFHIFSYLKIITAEYGTSVENNGNNQRDSVAPAMEMEASKIENRGTTDGNNGTAEMEQRNENTMEAVDEIETPGTENSGTADDRNNRAHPSRRVYYGLRIHPSGNKSTAVGQVTNSQIQHSASGNGEMKNTKSIWTRLCSESEVSEIIDPEETDKKILSQEEINKSIIIREVTNFPNQNKSSVDGEKSIWAKDSERRGYLLHIMPNSDKAPSESFEHETSETFETVNNKTKVCVGETNRSTSKQPHLPRVQFQSKGFCKKGFKPKPRVEMHRKRHLGEQKGFQCPFCEKKFTNKEIMLKHKEGHYVDIKLKFKCYFCKKKFKIQKDLNIHQAEVHAEEYWFKCDICKIKFSSHSNLLAHRRGHMSKNSLARGIFMGKVKEENLIMMKKRKIHFQCDFCKRRFSSAKAKLNHDRLYSGDTNHPLKTLSHNDIFKQNFSSITDALSSRKIHDENTALNFSVSRKNLKYTSALKKRHRIPKEKPLCSICGKRYFDKRNLSRHFREVHYRCYKSHRIRSTIKDSDDRTFKCLLCGSGFKYKKNLTRHTKIHQRINSGKETHGGRFSTRLNVDRINKDD